MQVDGNTMLNETGCSLQGKLAVFILQSSECFYRVHTAYVLLADPICRIVAIGL